jgi:copper homeostasis protein (lipoprotein)
MRIAALLFALCLALGAPAAVAAPVTGIYTGVLPCADCEGISYRLHLRPDRAFVLETRYLGRRAGTPRAVLGVWSESADDRTVVLRQTGEPPLFFAIASPGVLRKLDAAGLPIASSLNHDLLRSTTVEPFQPLLSLQGMYSQVADAGVFRECLSRARFPVDASGDHAALESGYAAARAEPGQEVLVTIDARIAARPSLAGDRLEDALFVEKFRGAWPGETCGDPLATADLAGTRWVLTRIGDLPVAARPGTEGPYLQLAAKGGEVSGFAGCNRFMGAYKANGASIDFGRVASTMMACAGGMDQEQAFLEALRDARSWKIFGEHLELYDRDGGMVARFEARYGK